MTTLYQITEEYKALADLVEAGEISEADFALGLSQLKDAFENKVEQVAKFILSIKATCEAIKQEEQRLTERRRVAENKAEWLKNYLHKELTEARIDKVEGELVTVSLRKAPPSCEVEDEALVPQDFKRHIPERWEVDKRRIMDDWRAGARTPPGVKLITDKRIIMIR